MLLTRRGQPAETGAVIIMSGKRGSMLACLEHDILRKGSGWRPGLLLTSPKQRTDDTNRPKLTP